MYFEIKKAYHLIGLYNYSQRRPTLPLSHPSSTIGAEELNCRVRYGNGCFIFAIVAENFITYGN